MGFYVGSTTAIENMIADTNSRVAAMQAQITGLVSVVRNLSDQMGAVMTSQEQFNQRLGSIDADLDVIREGVQGLRQHATNLEAVVAQLQANSVDTSALDPVVAEARALADGFRAVVVPEETTPPAEDLQVEPVDGADTVEPLPEPAEDTSAPADDAPAEPVAPSPADSGDVTPVEGTVPDTDPTADPAAGDEGTDTPSA